ncbi:MAG: PQQ-binding-like beta-propeller repeat protein [Polyangiaceae bacterium]
MKWVTCSPLLPFAVAAALAVTGFACSRSELIDWGTIEGLESPIFDAGLDATDAAEDADDAATKIPVALSCTKEVFDVCGTNMYQPGAPWPTYQRCSSHLGRTTAVGPTNPVILWQDITAGADLIGPPSISADGTIYFTGKGSLSAINPDGSAKWNAELTDLDTGESTVAVGPDGTIFVALDRVYAVSATGSQEWSSLPLTAPGSTGVFGSLGSSGSSVALGPCGTLYIGSALGLLMMDQHGNEIWAHNGEGLTPAVTSAGAAFYGSTEGEFFAVQPTGATQWTFTAEEADATSVGWIQPAPALGPDGTLYYGASDGLYAISANGTKLWELPWASDTQTGALASLAVGADGTIYVAAPDTSLDAVSPDGKLAWSLPLSVTGTPPVIDGNGVVFALAAGGVYAVLPTGHVEWTLTLPASEGGAFALGADGTLYVAAAGLTAIGNAQ